MAKVQTIKLLDEWGFNTPELILNMSQFEENKPVIWEGKLAKLSEEEPSQRVSIRTERDGEVLCPHYPNISLGDADKRIRDLHKKGYAIYIFRGIDPVDARVKGNIYRAITGTHGEYHCEFTVGPGTVRSLDKEAPEVYYAKIRDSIQGEQEVIVLRNSLGVMKPDLMGIFHWLILKYHHEKEKLGTDILEWSYYNIPVGKMRDHYIFWELRRWK